MEDYSDIINLSRPISRRPKMILEQRSAQFAPFAALTGYDGQVKEVARLTSSKIEIDEEVKIILDWKLQIIKENISSMPIAKITYFIPDEKKAGGKYETIVNSIRKIDDYNNTIIMSDGKSIDIKEVVDIQLDKIEST